jgi:hypothetical protein
MDLEIYLLIGFGNWDFMPDVINETRDPSEAPISLLVYL